MHNVYIVRSPLQLLAAYSVVHQLPEAANDLLLIGFRGDRIRKSCAAMAAMVADREAWRQTTVIEHRVIRRSGFARIRGDLEELRRRLSFLGPVDNIFLGSDNRVDSQLIVELTGHSTYARLDDGLFSYSSPVAPPLKRLKRFLWAKVVRAAAGMDGDFPYNYRGGGHGRACSADYLFKPELLRRFSPRPVRIERTVVRDCLRKVRGLELLPSLMEGPSVLFLGSLAVESKLLVAREEARLLKRIAEICLDTRCRLVYKTHPRENREKVRKYVSEIPSLAVFDSAEPVELLFHKAKDLRCVVSHQSSGMLFADTFGREGLAAIALFECAKAKNENAALRSVMQGAGVRIPATEAEFERILREVLPGAD